jgi:hypothetical protein
MNEKKRTFLGKSITEKLYVNREVDKKERNKTELVQVSGIPLYSWSVCLICRDSIEQQTLQGDDVSKQMRICGACTWRCGE